MKTTFVDVDGHILEPSDLWQKNLEPRFRHRAMRFERDENGLEYWVMDEKIDRFLSNGTAANLATIGKSKEWRRKNIFEEHMVTWEEGRALNPAACDPHERVKMMDQEGIDKSILYPSLGLSWMGLVRDPDLAAAYCRVYNDWLVDFCRHYSQRLYPAILLPWTDVSESVTELKRTATIGSRAVMCPASPPHDLPYGDSRWDPLWAEFQQQDLPVALHVGAGGTNPGSLMYPDIVNPSWWIFTNTTNVQLSFMSFFQGGVFDRFPDLKLVVLESGVLWMPYMLDRMDEKFEIIGFTTQTKHKPSEYFQKRGWISMDPDDEFGPIAINRLGADRFLWAYDYPHSDSPLNPVPNLKENLKDLPEEDQRKVMGGNAIDLYKLN
ncbi:MAG: amidohydrolase family protein [Dehalococcoidia bacterium]